MKQGQLKKDPRRSHSWPQLGGEVLNEVFINVLWLSCYVTFGGKRSHRDEQQNQSALRQDQVETTLSSLCATAII